MYLFGFFLILHLAMGILMVLGAMGAEKGGDEVAFGVMG